MKKLINIQLEESLISVLDNYATELNTTKSHLIEKAVSAYFDTLDEMVSEQRIDEVN